MTTTDHLNRIAAKCRELLEKRGALGSDYNSHQIAAWRSTIAAIEMACEMRAHLLAEFGDGWRCDFVDDKIKLIIAAWPEELL